MINGRGVLIYGQYHIYWEREREREREKEKERERERERERVYCVCIQRGIRLKLTI